MEKDSLGIVKQEASKLFVVYLIPGFTASLPCLLAVQKRYPYAGVFLQNHTEVLLLLFLVVSLAAGFIIEDVGSIIERYYCDGFAIKQRAKRKTPAASNDAARIEFYKIWDSFLTMKFKADEVPIGHRYLQDLVLRLKFELSFGLALLILYASLLLFSTYLDFHLKWWHHPAILGLISFLILYEAPRSSEVLDETRETLVKKYCT